MPGGSGPLILWESPHPRPWDLGGGRREYGGRHAGQRWPPFVDRHSLWLFPLTLYPCAFQGKVHLELRLSEVITDTGVVCHKLAAR